MKKFLVAARADRGGVAVGRERIEALLREHGFDGYFETSAKEGWNVPELAEAIRSAIDWETLPRVHSNALFHRIKQFLVAEKEAGRLLASADDLYRALLRVAPDLADMADLRAQFETCVGRVENRGLIRRLTFGDLVLLQPERLDAYASALVNAAKAEPDGLGSIAERAAQACAFPMPADERIKDRGQEKLLLIATIEDLLRHEIALREQGGDGPYLVFPSQLTRDWEEAPDPPGRSAVVTFEGPVLNVYATLAVRLSHSGLFARDQMWRNAAIYKADVGGACGLYLREFGEGRAELTLFHDAAASRETRARFEQFVLAHLRSKALAETIQVRCVTACPACGEPVPDRSIEGRRKQGFGWIACAHCDARVDLEAPAGPACASAGAAVTEMGRRANAERDRSAALSVIQGKLATGDFDVFLCHNHDDKPAVRAIGERLKALGVLPWLDERELKPSQPYYEELEGIITTARSAAVFLGPHGIGRFQRMEIEALLNESLKRGIPLMPVFLPDAPEDAEPPVFLRLREWVDFRKAEPDPLEKLVWGITGRRGVASRDEQ